MSSARLDLSPEEESFFEAGEAIDEGAAAAPGEGEARRRRRRHHHHQHRYPWLRRFGKLRGGSLVRLFKSAVLMVVAVWVGYRVSMLVLDTHLPSASEFGVDTR